MTVDHCGKCHIPPGLEVHREVERSKPKGWLIVLAIGIAIAAAITVRSGT